jgi:ferritin-like protein
VCYQELEANISFIKEHGVDKFEKVQKDKEKLLKRMLSEFDDGSSKSYYCIATTILNENELNKALSKAESEAEGLDQKEKAKLLHSILDDIAVKKGKCIKLRKQIS